VGLEDSTRPIVWIRITLNTYGDDRINPEHLRATPDRIDRERERIRSELFRDDQDQDRVLES
jgi:hypothetical protein